MFLATLGVALSFVASPASAQVAQSGAVELRQEPRQSERGERRSQLQRDRLCEVIAPHMPSAGQSARVTIEEGAIAEIPPDPITPVDLGQSASGLPALSEVAGHAFLNPQPLPPVERPNGSLNPQPLRPGPADRRIVVELNPQPLPPVDHREVRLNPQPLPPEPPDETASVTPRGHLLSRLNERECVTANPQLKR